MIRREIQLKVVATRYGKALEELAGRAKEALRGGMRGLDAAE
jgi:hypothetical protein